MIKKSILLPAVSALVLIPPLVLLPETIIRTKITTRWKVITVQSLNLTIRLINMFLSRLPKDTAILLQNLSEKELTVFY